MKSYRENANERVWVDRHVTTYPRNPIHQDGQLLESHTECKRGVLPFVGISEFPELLGDTPPLQNGGTASDTSWRQGSVVTETHYRALVTTVVSEKMEDGIVAMLPC
jgi:hypothetical protein